MPVDVERLLNNSIDKHIIKKRVIALLRFCILIVLPFLLFFFIFFLNIFPHCISYILLIQQPKSLAVCPFGLCSFISGWGNFFFPPDLFFCISLRFLSFLPSGENFFAIALCLSVCLLLPAYLWHRYGKEEEGEAKTNFTTATIQQRPIIGSGSLERSPDIQ